MSKTTWFIYTQLGLNPRMAIRAVKALPWYLSDLLSFRKTFKGKLTLLPCFHDRYDESGFAKSEYFWQDLYVAQRIFESNPIKHVDIGSRIDGFVAHVASFREVEVIDIRPLNVLIPMVKFKQMDFMDPNDLIENYCDSISCLHTLEHFGLGRYGDKIDIKGYESGFKNMTKMLSKGGIFYLSVPIGLEKVEFNSHRVFDPNTIRILAKQSCLRIKSFAWVGKNNVFVESLDPENDLKMLGDQPYSLGIFTFCKDE